MTKEAKGSSIYNRDENGNFSNQPHPDLVKTAKKPKDDDKAKAKK
jgi:hypothetical protein